MSIKKKLGLGVASAALGLSLVGGGTWAAFNDTATINNHFASGTLDLAVIAKKDGQPINFDLSNMKPGDSVERIFTLKNNGTLAIKEVLFNATAGNFKIGDKTAGEGDMHAFLSQFQVDVFNVDRSTGAVNSIYNPNEVANLSEFVKGTYLNKVKPSYKGTVAGTLNLTHLISPYPDSVEGGLPAGDLDDVQIKISFIDNDEKDAKGEYKQNIFQNNKVDFKFNLEATQWDGVEVRSTDGNGEVNNGVQYSADGVKQPDPRTKAKDNGTGEAVTD
ncbi:TasA family protein [Bacillus sp. FJAT-29937]|uniref:TasA family protein n=1 Tax=Bacillus sp. FJAT-29937 TaxID=1720553 RepID=UPI00082BCFCE|nr:TasA family protein [Bacillus sp. FJAT-29937]